MMAITQTADQLGVLGEDGTITAASMNRRLREADEASREELAAAAAILDREQPNPPGAPSPGDQEVTVASATTPPAPAGEENATEAVPAAQPRRPTDAEFYRKHMPKSPNGLKPAVRFLTAELNGIANEFPGGYTLHRGDPSAPVPTGLTRETKDEDGKPAVRGGSLPYLSVLTEPIRLKNDRGTVEVDLGRFEIVIEMARMTNARNIDCSMVRAYARDPRPCPGDNDVPHPHVRGVCICFGAGETPVRKALLQGRLTDVFGITLQILKTYNSGSPYRTIESWVQPDPEQEEEDDASHCTDCDEETSYVCVSCDTSICGGCGTRCSECEGDDTLRCGACASRHFRRCDCCETAATAARMCSGCSNQFQYGPRGLRQTMYRCTPCHEEDQGPRPEVISVNPQPQRGGSPAAVPAQNVRPSARRPVDPDFAEIQGPTGFLDGNGVPERIDPTIAREHGVALEELGRDQQHRGWASP